MLYFRSWDLWAGFPSNLAGIQLLKEYMAKEIGVEDGEMIASSKGMHLYDYCWDLAMARTEESDDPSIPPVPLRWKGRPPYWFSSSPQRHRRCDCGWIQNFQIPP